jgi:UDP-N-acetylglucosamine 1-carboxyvinyltransferase
MSNILCEIKKDSKCKEKFIMSGNAHLKGTITVSGSKNAALPIICATLMHPGNYTLKNVPEINDVKVIFEIIEKLGAKVSRKKINVYEINTKNLNSWEPDLKLVRNVRASILLIGPLLYRFGRVKIAQPGGCFIGSRPLLTHFKALRDMGVRIIRSGEYYHLSIKKIKDNNTIILRELSVTATAIAIMVAALTKKTKIRLAAAEPHIEDLCDFLKKMGVDLKGCGTHNITVSKKKLSSNFSHTIIPDQIEAGTLAVAAVVSRGAVTIKNFIPQHHDALLSKFEEMGVNFIIKKNILYIKRTTILKPTDIRTDIYPGFPTDLQAPMAVLLTQAEGTSEIHETMFEGRLNYIKELKKMGADVVIRDAHHALISGPTALYGKKIKSFDLRAGATLIIAGLIAEGESEISEIHLIDRGYEKIEEKLNSLGANIKRVSTKS